MGNEVYEGRVYGQLTVVRRVGSGMYYKTREWECRCSCGELATVRERYLREGKTLRCETCRDTMYTMYPGDRYGKWTVIEEIPYDPSVAKAMVRVRCECGNVSISQRCRIRNGVSTMCRDCAMVGALETRMRNNAEKRAAKEAEEKAQLDSKPETEEKRQPNQWTIAPQNAPCRRMPVKRKPVLGVVEVPKWDTTGYKEIRCDVFDREGFLKEHPMARGLEKWLDLNPKETYNTDDWIAYVRWADSGRINRKLTNERGEIRGRKLG